MKQNKKIAITGGIGSGKSTVANIIKQKGNPVFSCDEVYKDLLSDKNFLNLLKNEFGDEIIEGGALNRKILSQIVFSDKSKLQRLNRITHPVIMNEMFKRAEEFNCTSYFEVPLLFENSFEGLFDGVIVVLRDLDKRIESVVKRDNLPSDEVLKRINEQYNYENNNFAKYYVIHNNSHLTHLKEQIDKILLKI
jgi:dephospho-CoA kinase